MRSGVAYVRVSTAEQAQHGVSLDAQEERIRAYCTMAGLDLVAVIREEGVSGSKALATRPGGQQVISLVQAGTAQPVVALKLDRLFRDVVDALNQTRVWDKSGIALHVIDMGSQAICTTTAMGRMFLTLTPAFAELERNLISERTKTAMADRKAQGAKFGGPAIGETDGERATVARVLEVRKQSMSLRDLAERLTSEGFPTKKGGPWGAETVRKILAREGVA